MMNKNDDKSTKTTKHLLCTHINFYPGVYIVQNTMARGGGEMVPGKKMKNEAVGNKMKKKEKGERKKKKRIFC